jgi:hypothetical protein
MSFILSLVLLASAGTSGVTPLRWVSPNNSKPLSFSAWRSQQAARPFKVKPLLSPRRLETRVDFFIEETLANALLPALETLATDLESETVAVSVFSVSGTSAESLKAVLAAEHQTGMSSAVLVGNLPVAWFQMLDDFDNNGIGEGYEEFPCDLFYMDLDGIWKDSLVRDSLDSLVAGSDSIYDVHEGSIIPDIAVSRLPASTVGNAESLLVAYFDRAHRYRNGQLPVSDRALVYIDDDWQPFATEWDSNVGLLYHDRVLVSDSEATRIADYKPRIDSAAYQWISLMSHSWPGGHAMYYHQKDSMDWFYGESIPPLDPQASFYNLFACSNSRFVENGYCGGRYVFQTTTGLGSIGSTKTGSMLSFGYFYDPLGQGATLGEAFRQWFAAIFSDGCDPSERSWFYGMCLIADGSLKPRVPQTGIAEQRRDMTEMSGISNRAPSVRLLGNPARAHLNLELNLGQPASCRVALLDRVGRTVTTISQGAFSAGTHILSANVGNLPAGVYFLSVRAGNTSSHTPVTLVH